MKSKKMNNLTFIAIVAIGIIAIIMAKSSQKNNNSFAYNHEEVQIYDNDNQIGEIVEINVDIFNKIKDSDKVSLIYIGRPSCSACVFFYPIIEEVSSEYNLDIFYANLDNWSKDDISNVLLNSLNKFEGTPTLLIMYNGKQVAATVGYQEKKQLVSFLKENYIIKTNY